jgi:DNA repair protein RadC
MANNHPSCSPSASSEDITATGRITEGGKMIGMEPLDHVIIGDGKFISLREKNLF